MIPSIHATGMGVTDSYHGPDRRTPCDEPDLFPTGRGKLVSNRNAAYVEQYLMETQAASDAAQQRVAHAIATMQTLQNELRAARAACVAARQAARTATGILSGAES